MVQNRLGEWALARFVQRTKVRSPKMHQNFTVTNCMSFVNNGVGAHYKKTAICEKLMINF